MCAQMTDLHQAEPDASAFSASLQATDSQPPIRFAISTSLSCQGTLVGAAREVRGDGSNQQKPVRLASDLEGDLKSVKTTKKLPGWRETV